MGTVTPTAQNRVTPLGDVEALPGRGAWMGNRGRLHEGAGTRVVLRRHQTKAWIACVLSFKDRHAPQWAPSHYTPLFFLDEAVALAAGHRPCAECRRADFNAYRGAWPQPSGSVPRAREMDERLHAERTLTTSGRALRATAWDGIPDGVFVMVEAGPAVVVGDHIAVWDGATNTYAAQLNRPRSGTVDIITPPSSVSVLKAGYPVQIDDTAR